MRVSSLEQQRAESVSDGRALTRRSRFRLVGSLWFALAASALTLAARGAEKPAVPLRELSRADEQRVRELYAKAVAFGRVGKFDEAQGPVREILELRTRVQGEDHFETGDARREIETLKKLAALPKAGRVEYMKTYVLSDEMGKLWQQGRYADALRPAEQVLDMYRRLLGPEHTYVALAANYYGQLLHFDGRYADAEAQYRV